MLQYIRDKSPETTSNFICSNTNIKDMNLWVQSFKILNKISLVQNKNEACRIDVEVTDMKIYELEI